jgi:hypothetical protein
MKKTLREIYIHSPELRGTMEVYHFCEKHFGPSSSNSAKYDLKLKWAWFYDRELSCNVPCFKNAEDAMMCKLMFQENNSD